MRLSVKERRPSSEAPCFNEGCPNTIDTFAQQGRLCKPCARAARLGLPPPKLTGAAALLAEIEAKRTDPARHGRDHTYTGTLARLVRLFGPSSLDKTTERTLDRLFPDEQFADVVRQFFEVVPLKKQKFWMRLWSKRVLGGERVQPRWMLSLAVEMLRVAEEM